MTRCLMVSPLINNDETTVSPVFVPWSHPAERALHADVFIYNAQVETP